MSSFLCISNEPTTISISGMGTALSGNELSGNPRFDQAKGGNREATISALRKDLLRRIVAREIVRKHAK